MTAIVRASFELAMEPVAAFDHLVEDLVSALEPLKVRFDAGPDGRISGGAGPVARVKSWRPGERILLLGGSPSDPEAEGVGIEFSFRAAGAGTLVTVEVRNWATLLGDWGDVPGWFTSHVMAPLLAAMEPERLGDWITDRAARRPAGRQARATYRDPLYHYPNFRVILEELALGPDDHLLEVGCGGGALLREGLGSGCRAAAVDHSLDMVRVARSANGAAVNEARLAVLNGSANRLPFRDGTFTCAAMTGVLGFLADPVAALAEIRRTLLPGGRLVALGSDPELRGTPAAPEPMASRLRFYDDDELGSLGRQAGFEEVRVIHRDLERYARESGVPDEHIRLFAGITRFLIARRH